MHCRVLPLLILAGVASCDTPEAESCLLIIAPAIQVEVRDSTTGQPLAFNARGVITDGRYSDSLRVIGWDNVPSDSTALILGAGDNRAGTYHVTIVRPGYLPWVAGPVRVRKGTCFVDPVRLSAKLQPAS